MANHDPGQTCSLCGKQGFVTRKGARSCARRAHPGSRLSVYDCAKGFWHYGHLPARVADGRVPRNEIGQALRKENAFYTRPAA